MIVDPSQVGGEIKKYSVKEPKKFNPMVRISRYTSTPKKTNGKTNGKWEWQQTKPKNLELTSHLYFLVIRLITTRYARQNRTKPWQLQRRDTIRFLMEVVRLPICGVTIDFGE